ncbi:transcription elongation factor GreA [Candidatus Curtissbacteria bacterium]|nr:transcription elongation factor GreA [Candidatus Curtissbacteria bacterium]
MAKKQSFQFTKEGFENLKKELRELEARRPQVVTNLSNAREQGDLSENAGYHAAKDELSQIDSRIRELKYLLRVGNVVEKQKSGIVTFGCLVTVEANGSQMEFNVVEELEADPAKGKISTSSPIGSALLGKKVGEIVEVETPEGKITYKISKII